MAGNYNSGRRRKRAHNLVENYPAIDINHLNKAGALHWGSPPTLLEWRNGTVAVIIPEETQFGELTAYLYNRYGDDSWEAQKLATIAVPQRVGRTKAIGPRYYFNCPGCGRRIWRLHLVSCGFVCRLCAHLRYSTEYEPEWCRAERRVRKIERRLGDPAYLYEKPRGMRHSTYARLLTKVIEADDIAAGVLVRRLERLAGWIDKEWSNAERQRAKKTR